MRQLEDETLRAVARLAANSDEMIAHALKTAASLASGEPEAAQMVVHLAVMNLRRAEIVAALHDRFVIEGHGFGDWIKEKT